MSKLQAAREQAIHLLRLGYSSTKVAATLGRSPQWVRKCWRRYQASGWTGLADRSRAPHHHGGQFSTTVRAAVVKARSEVEAAAARGTGLKYIGAKAVRTRLKAKHVMPLPSVPTIERILHAAAMTRPKAPTVQVVYPRLRPQRPHELCQVDHIPRYLQGGAQVFCFNAIDVVSRYPTGQVYSQRRAADAGAFLIHVWQTIGIPHYTQVDNEACCSGGFTHAWVLGQCVRLALLIGTELVFSPLRHPKSNGTVERFHQDYQAHVWQDTYLAGIGAVQKRAERFFHLYRQSAHHSALQGATPATVHNRPAPVRLAAGFRPVTGKIPLYAGRLHFMRRLSDDGTVTVLNRAWSVPHTDPHTGVWVTIELSPQSATLTIYDAAPDVQSRHALAIYPFPVQEPVLRRPRNDHRRGARERSQRKRRAN
jgi:transposase InsO family protein